MVTIVAICLMLWTLCAHCGSISLHPNHPARGTTAIRLLARISGNSLHRSLVGENTVVKDEEEEEFSNNNKKSTSASVQWMITSRMRSILINDLGYLESEVDDMEPQIAAVVIERNLRRPLKGMPASWKKTKPNIIMLKFQSMKGTMVIAMKRTSQFYFEHRKVLLPATIIASGLVSQQAFIVEGARRVWNVVCTVTGNFKGNNKCVQQDMPLISKHPGSPSLPIKDVVSSIWSKLSPTRRVTSTFPADSSMVFSPPTKVDILALDRLQSKSWFSNGKSSGNK